MTHIHIDTDMGIDDALAIAVATRLPGLRIVAVSTVFGNVPLDIATRNAGLIRCLLAPRLDVPLLRGAAAPLSASRADARAVHGDDGLGGVTASLDTQLLRQSGQAVAGYGTLEALIRHGPPAWLQGGEKVTLVGLGPATNLPALAAWYGPALAGIVLMSGVFFDSGNITPAAEFNAYCDPDALSATLALGVPVSFVPLDLCRKVVLTGQAIDAWRKLEPGPAMQLLSAAHAHYIAAYRASEGLDGCFPHDTLAVLAAYRPESFFALEGGVMVEVSGHRRGATTFNAGSNRHVKLLTGGDLAWIRKGLASLSFATS